MNAFRWIAVVFGMILGLGVARVLTSAVAVFRSRHHARIDWVPLTWAGCVFLWQLQYWWAIIELPSLFETWTLGAFLVLLGLALLLFVAGALVLPPEILGDGEGLRERFDDDGRWALACLSAYFSLAIFADWLLWDTHPFSYLGALLFVLLLLPLVFLATKSERVQEVITLLYVPLSLWAALELSPAAY